MTWTHRLLSLSFAAAILASAGSAAAQSSTCRFVVDAAGTVGVGEVTHTSIQTAVTDLPNPGPCLVVVKPGTYVESVQVAGVNTLAESDSQRIVIFAERPADAASTDGEKSIVTPPTNGGEASTFGFRIEGSRRVTVKSFDVRGAREGIVVDGAAGGGGNEDIVVDGNDLHSNGAGSHRGAIVVGANSARTWVVNNLVRDNVGNGILVEGTGSPGDDTVYLVNNTVLRNGFNGVRASRKRLTYLVNNLIVANGTADLKGQGQATSEGADAGRWGLFREPQGGQGVLERTSLLHNFFYRNGEAQPAGHGGDIANASLVFADGSDEGNYTTHGDETGAPAVVGCVFADCTGTTALSALFRDPAGDFRHAEGSPAIDRGLDTLVHNGAERVPGMDFEGDARPQDGNGDGTAIVDVGHDEAPEALPAFRAIADCSPMSGVVPLKVRFRSRGEFRGGSIVRYRWDFEGDGNFDTSDPVPQDFFHTFTSPGVFVAVLEVTNNLGATAEDTCTVQAASAPPLATADADPSNGPAPLSVTFTGTGFKSGGGIVLHEWDFEGDGVFDVAISDFPSAQPDTLTFVVNHATCGSANQLSFFLNDTLILAATGTVGCICNSLEPTFTVSDPAVLSAWNPAGGNVLKVVAGSSVDVAYIRAEPVPGEPVCVFDAVVGGSCTNRNLCNGFRFGGTFSAPAETGVTRSTVEHTYDTPGTYPAVFRITDDEGKTVTASAASTSVRVGPPGTPIVRASATPTSGDAPLAVSFNGSSTDDGTIVLWEWDFDGDGTFDYSSPTSPATTFTYLGAGRFVVALRATDDTGLSSIDLVEVEVGLVATLSIPDDTFDPTRGETVVIQTTISGSAPVRLLLLDGSRRVVRTLVDATRSPGSYSDAWDGRDDAGAILPQAPYYAVLEFDAAGETQRVDLTDSTGGVRYNPSRNSLPRLFRPFEDDLLMVRFNIPSSRGASEVLAFIGLFNVDTRFITLLERVPLGVGIHTIHWDGRAPNGSPAQPPPGDSFLFGIFGFTLPDNAIMVQSAPVLSNVSVDPNYFDPATPDFLSTDAPAAVLTYTVDKLADVELTVTNLQTGIVVRRILLPGVAAGSGHTISWDGRTENGLHADKGDHRLTLRAVDSTGSASINRFALVRVFY